MADESANDLEAILPARFRENLSEAERRLLRAAAEGEVAMCGPSFEDKDNNPAKADAWGREREIRAAMIRWLCVDPEASKRVDPRGVSAYGAKVTGELDLSFVTVMVPLRLARSRLTDNCDMKSIKLPALYLDGSLTRSLNAENADVRGSVFLSDGFSADGQVRLSGARVGGDLDCQRGRFKNPGGIALDAHGSDIKGIVFLSDGFSAEGEVDLAGARIGGQLDCERGTFQNPPRRALNADGAEVSTYVLLRYVRAEGEVNLLRAHVGSNLECDHSSLKNPGSTALDAGGAEIKGSVFLRDGFSSEGQVNLPEAQIGGQLDCDRGTFKNPSGRALNVDGAKVSTSVFLTNARAEGEVNLTRAHIGNDLECDRGSLRNPSGTALYADGAEIGGSVFLRDDFSAEGEVNLLWAQVGGVLDCDRGSFRNPSGRALNAGGAEVRAVFLTDARVEGEVNLTRAHIGNDLDCDRGSFRNPGGTALYADGAEIKGSAFLRDDFSAEGQVNLSWAQIGGALQCSTWKEAQRASLDLRRATVGDIWDDEPSWPMAGNLYLDGFVYGSISGGPTDAPTRLKWLDRQGEFTPQPYRQLARVLHELGDDEGAKQVLFELEGRARAETRRRLISAPRRWFHVSEDAVSNAAVGYGIYPVRAVRYLSILFALGWIVHRRAQRNRMIAPTDKDAYQAFYENNGTAPAYYPKFSPLVYSLENCLPLVKFGQDDRWQPDPDAARRLYRPLPALASRAWFKDFLFVRIPDWTCSPVTLRRFRWIMIALGWLLATFFVAGITGIIKTG